MALDKRTLRQHLIESMRTHLFAQCDRIFNDPECDDEAKKALTAEREIVNRYLNRRKSEIG